MTRETLTALQARLAEIGLPREVAECKAFINRIMAGELLIVSDCTNSYGDLTHTETRLVKEAK